MRKFVFQIIPKKFNVTWQESRNERMQLKPKKKIIEALNLEDAQEIAAEEVEKLVDERIAYYSSRWAVISDVDLFAEIKDLFSIHEFSAEDQMAASGNPALFDRDAFLVVPA